MAYKHRNMSFPPLFFDRLKAYAKKKKLPVTRVVLEWCSPRLAEVDPEFRKYQEAKSKLEEMER